MSGTFFVRTASPTSTISPPELRRSSSLSSDAMNLRISASTCAGGEVERACAWTYSPTIEDSRAETIRSCLGVISAFRSEEHTSELQSLMRISYAVFCLKKKKSNSTNTTTCTDHTQTLMHNIK